ncbi:uncharacterized protein PRCAT00005089001 [Priceomyces carsonii]|uniref:uncharacterized protein n=1 Tax=Priceomyces carsonii TaxID=28549 RepID=UPI002EDB199E|nr:unnamed protein product [Priceomyces carsonii]
MTINLQGKVALVTGGTSGLGEAVCRQFAAEGVNLAINYNKSKEKAGVLVKELILKFKIKAVSFQADSTDGEGIDNLVESVLKEFGKLDIVISNVGWTKIVPYDDLDALDDELWDGCFNANVKSHFKLFKSTKRYLEQNKEGGTFIVTASVAGRIVYGSSIPYAVSKAALIHLVRMLAKTQGPSIRIHAVCPGLLLTEWGKQFSPERIESTKSRSPLHVLADVDESASHFLQLSKLSTSTGTIVGIDAGISI